MGESTEGREDVVAGGLFSSEQVDLAGWVSTAGGVLEDVRQADSVIHSAGQVGTDADDESMALIKDSHCLVLSKIQQDSIQSPPCL